MKFTDFKNTVLADEKYFGKNEKSVVVSDNDIEQSFNVYLDKNDNFIFNLNSTLYFDINPNDILYYTVKFETCNWPLLSYKIYGTTHLMWLLLKLNNISAENIFDVILPGTTIRCVSKKYVTEIINSLND